MHNDSISVMLHVMAPNQDSRARREIVQFEAHVPAGGFRWIDGFDENKPEQPRRFLIPRRAWGVRNLTLRPLPPSPEPMAGSPPERLLGLSDLPTALFRTFALIEPTEDGILAFANLYGDLGGSCAKSFILEDDGSVDTPRALTGVPHGEWERQIWLMHQAVVLWEAHRAADDRLVTELITTDTVTARGHSLTFMGVKSTGVPIGWEMLLQLARTNPMRPREAAPLLLDQVISHELEGMKLRSNGLRLTAMPDGLHAFLWYQLLQAIGRNARHVSCEVCGTWFEPLSRREPVKYCSSKCQMRAYRCRKSSALTTRAEDLGTPKRAAKKRGKREGGKQRR